MKIIWMKPLIITATLFALSACSHNPVHSNAPTKNADTIQLTQTGLANRYFVLEQVNGEMLTFGPRQPELLFGENLRLSGGMCNRFNGQATLEGQTLKAPRLAATMMLCEPTLNDLERDFFQMMQNGATLEVVEDKLILSDPQKKTVLTFKPAIQPKH